ncbi:hypothetical protein E2C01_064579 [Portunus trituberculatus]|uniref:Uncharacterized protein n=1 Tax=Portunus trituberculatus TaxID=210409 RepID=A0A5B7HL75_PORTR|nr:hypothetical protein [Portunus trituberculatus]
MIRHRSTQASSDSFRPVVYFVSETETSFFSPPSPPRLSFSLGGFYCGLAWPPPPRASLPLPPEH